MRNVAYKIASQRFNARKLLRHLVEVAGKHTVLLVLWHLYPYREVSLCNLRRSLVKLPQRLQHYTAHKCSKYRSQYYTYNKRHYDHKIYRPVIVLLCKGVNAEIFAFHRNKSHSIWQKAAGFHKRTVFVYLVNMLFDVGVVFIKLCYRIGAVCAKIDNIIRIILFNIFKLFH